MGWVRGQGDRYERGQDRDHQEPDVWGGAGQCPCLGQGARHQRLSVAQQDGRDHEQVGQIRHHDLPVKYSKVLVLSFVSTLYIKL